ncbi:hypothetical protein IV102_00745 [bacterium]|nr:hypothetical protein [bacterium]
MTRGLLSFLVILLLAAACARLWQPAPPAPLFAQPLSPTSVVACLDALRKVGIASQLDAQGTGLLVDSVALTIAHTELARRGLPRPPVGPVTVPDRAGNLRETLSHYPGVNAASLLVSEEEALVMLDLQHHPTSDLLTMVRNAVTAARPKIQSHNIKIVDAQCRDWTASPEAPRNPNRRQTTAERLSEEICVQLQRELDTRLGWGKAHLTLAMSWVAYDRPWYTPYPTDTRRPKLDMQISLVLAGLTLEQQTLAVEAVSKLKGQWRLRDSRGDVFAMKVGPWTASQRPLSRVELEQLKRGLVTAAPPPPTNWWGLGLLGPGLILWGVATQRLLDRHRLASA